MLEQLQFPLYYVPQCRDSAMGHKDRVYDASVSSIDLLISCSAAYLFIFVFSLNLSISMCIVPVECGMAGWDL